MKYKAKPLLLIFFCLFILNGCTTKYTKDDITHYVNDTIGLTNFTVSDEYRIFVGDDDYEDKIWTITDNNTGMKFHVIDDFYWGMEAVTNSLDNDYTDTLLIFLQNDLPHTQSLNVAAKEEKGIQSCEIIGYFENEPELKACYRDLQKLQKAFSLLGYPNLSARYCFRMEHPLRYHTSQELTEGDSNGWLNELPDYQEMLNKYVLAVLDYRYDGTLESLTEQQIANALDNSPQQVGILRDPASQTFEFYDDIAANAFHGISFGTLYEILLREGFQPQGSPCHYTFTGSDGSVYEISYDFNDYTHIDSSGDTWSGYYYIRSGEIVPMDYYFYNWFEENEVQEMTGLQITSRSENTLQ